MSLVQSKACSLYRTLLNVGDIFTHLIALRLFALLHSVNGNLLVFGMKICATKLTNQVISRLDKPYNTLYTNHFNNTENESESGSQNNP